MPQPPCSSSRLLNRLLRSLQLRSSVLVMAVIGLGLLPACSSTHPDNSEKDTAHFQTGESAVLAGEHPANLVFQPSHSPHVTVRSTYLEKTPGTIVYQEGQDYLLDYQAATIQRTAGSRIPDFSTNLLYGKVDFDHSKFPGYGNKPFIVYIDYAHKQKVDWSTQTPQKGLLAETVKKLKNGDKLKIVAFGDSITAGGEASQTNLIYWQRWADALQNKYPRAKIEAINGATGGDTTRNGLERLQTKVINEQPDLVLIGFGMNDQNIQPFGVPLDQFKENLRKMINRIRSTTKADVILLSAFPPNPQWHFGSHQMDKYAQATQEVAREENCAYANVYHRWVSIATNKKPEDLLGNNINHPNDFGHWIYFRVLKQLEL